MPKKKVIEPKIEEVIETPQEEKVFQVFDAKGDFVRDYRTEISGANCGEMAQELAKEIKGTVK
jgi:hypothetical protein